MGSVLSGDVLFDEPSTITSTIERTKLEYAVKGIANTYRNAISFKDVDKDYVEFAKISIDRLDKIKKGPVYKGDESFRLVPRTQKAKGIFDKKFPNLAGVKTATADFWPVQFVDSNIFENGIVFVRPAPMVPRHGFVESREASSWAEVLDIYNEALAAGEPEAELIFMQRFSGEISAVAHNGGVSWGKGNDGATGNGEASFIPAPIVPKNWNIATVGKKFEEKGITDTAYIELVFDKSNSVMVAVQRRSGPAQSAEIDFIPKNTVVKDIIEPCGSLLEWETLIKGASKEDGVVVFNKGSTLASHYAVHAIEAGIPVVSSKDTLSVGQLLEAGGLKRKKLNKRDRQKLAELVLEYESKNDLNTIAAPAAFTAVGSIHSMAHWDASPHLLRLRAFAVTTLVRLIHGASMGEMRHWYMHGPGVRRSVAPKTLHAKGKHWEDYRSENRSWVWRPYLKPMKLSERASSLRDITQDFNTEGWEEGSYGGKKWASISEAGAKLAKRLHVFTRHPTAGKWSDVVKAANVAVNMVHNGGGSAFSKWVSQGYLDLFAYAPGTAFVNWVAGAISLDIPLDDKMFSGASYWYDPGPDIDADVFKNKKKNEEEVEADEDDDEWYL